MKLTNLQGLPQPLVDAVAADDYDKGDADISVTSLIDPPRKVTLQRAFADQITEDAADRVWALLGQTMHTILERANRDAIAERRLFADVGGWRVSGQFDRMVAAPNQQGGLVLQDYKLCSVWEIVFGLKAEREAQLNAYAYLARVNGYHIDGLEIVAIMRDWSKSKAQREADYPQQQVRVIPVRLWPREEAVAYMLERVQLHRAARMALEMGEPLPSCSDVERWARGDTWAVMKAGRKSALRVLDSLGDAETYLLGVSDARGINIVRRPGESVRCANYCAAAPFCSQWAEMSREVSND
jgi:hypothetical protein